ncbi:Heterokaryon incompatibility protein 6, OR allele [Colletotrichum siamense]|nr:Heterokaryon incompatibility protein 6, OR allele [Colletotrichum siamense]
MAWSQVVVGDRDAIIEGSSGVSPFDNIYSALPIATEELRILNVHPASSVTSPVVADLFIENFRTQRKSYEALSYTWGDSTSPETITVNGVETNVTRNLRLALQTLRHQSRKPGGFKLWVDSICINQDNVPERNVQVAQMGKIYSQASHVAIWLGDASETSEAAMRLVNNCHKLNSDIEVIESVINDELGGRALTELLQRRYWKRMWVFQEIVLSRSATVYCGQHSARWDDFKRLDSISGRPFLWPGLEIRQGWIFDLRRALFGITQFCIGRTEAGDMTNVLQPTRNLESSDPHDKLYALLGVCDSDPFPPPDYSKPARDVYIDFTKSIIGQDDDLSILLTAGPWNPENGEDIGLPTWTPDYRGMKGMDIRYFAASHLGYFDATKGELPSQKASMHSSNPGSLPTDGIILDVVTGTVNLEAGEKSRQRVLEQIDPRGLGPHPTGKSQFEAFFETMIFYNIKLHGGNGLNSSVRKENLIRLTVGFIRELQLFYQGNRVHENNEVKDHMEFEIPSSELFDTAAEEYHRLFTTDPEDLHWRREEYVLRTEEVTQGSLTSIFATASNYIGRGLTSIRDGDVIAVLFGCKLPVVLRKCCQPSTFQFISPCYA